LIIVNDNQLKNINTHNVILCILLLLLLLFKGLRDISENGYIVFYELGVQSEISSVRDGEDMTDYDKRYAESLQLHEFSGDNRKSQRLTKRGDCIIL